MIYVTLFALCFACTYCMIIRNKYVSAAVYGHNLFRNQVNGQCMTLTVELLHVVQ